MARRRRKLGAAFEGISDVLGMLLQNQMIGQRQKELRDVITSAQQEGQIGGELSGLSKQVAEGRDPASAGAQFGAVQDLYGVPPNRRPPVDFSAMQPPAAKRTLAAMTPLLEAKGAEEISEDPALLLKQIQKRLLAQNIEPERPNLITPAGGPAFTGEPLLPWITQASAKRKELLAAEPKEAYKWIDPDTGDQFEDVMSDRERATRGGLLQTVPPNLEGERKLTSYEAFEGTPEYQRSQATAEGLKAGAAAKAQFPYRTQSTRQINTTNAAGDPVVQIIDAQTGAVTAEFPAGPTSEQRTRADARDRVQRSYTSIKGLADRLITKRGIAQRADATGRLVKDLIAGDPEFRAYQDSRRALAGELAVLSQGSRPSDADIERVWVPLVADVFADSPESAAIKWEIMRTMADIDATSAAPPTASPTATPPWSKGWKLKP